MNIVEIVSGVLLALGGFFVFVGGVGVIRMPDLYTRMHSASVTETLGTILILLGLMVTSGLNLATVKLAVILIFLLFTAPIASYAMANTALIAGLKPILGRSHHDQTGEPK
jgi:multicomponent Na+:H+ antiporter subunit G